MGTIELILLLILAFFYMAIPIVILLFLIRINNRLNEIEQVIKGQR